MDVFLCLAVRHPWSVPQEDAEFWEYVNLAFTAVSDVLILQFLGVRGFLYLFMSLWFGYGLHPAAGHFIQEHYTFDDGQETYSYYGSLNFFLLNVGYHNEHHDFTRVSTFEPSMWSIDAFGNRFLGPSCRQFAN